MAYTLVLLEILHLADLLEEDKRATTNVQNGLSFSFYSLEKGLNFKKSPGGNVLKKCEKVRKSVKIAEAILHFGCCPLVFL